MPCPEVPRQALIHRAGVGINERVDAGPVIAGAVPLLGEHLRRRLGTAYRVQYKPLRAAPLERGVPVVGVGHVGMIAGVQR